jgi:hypothetical protein
MGLQSECAIHHEQRSAGTHDDESLWACGFRCVCCENNLSCGILRVRAFVVQDGFVVGASLRVDFLMCAVFAGFAPQTRACECMHASWCDFDPNCCRVHQFAH